MAKRQLTPKQKKFADEYVTTRNGEQSENIAREQEVLEYYTMAMSASAM